MDESLKFYTEIAGLTVDSRFSPDENTDIAMLGNPESAKIELLDRKGYATAKNSKGISVGIKVVSLENMLERVKKNNIPIISGPVSPSPGLSFFMVSDPNGVSVQFVEEKR